MRFKLEDVALKYGKEAAKCRPRYFRKEINIIKKINVNKGVKRDSWTELS